MWTACSSDVTTLCPLTPAAPAPASVLSHKHGMLGLPPSGHITVQPPLHHTVLLGRLPAEPTEQDVTANCLDDVLFLREILKIASFLLFIPFFKHMLSQWCLPCVRGYSTVTWPSGLLWLCCGLQKEKLWNMRLIWKRASGHREGEKLCKPSKLVLAGEAL